MRRRLILLAATAAIALAALLPGAAAAYNPFEYTVLKNVCHTYGGAYGWGYALYKVRLTEYGKSGTTQFGTVTYLQRKVGGAWQNAQGPWNNYSTTIPNDAQTYTWASKQRYEFGEESAEYYHRLATHIEFWHYNTLISTKWVYGRSC